LGLKPGLTEGRAKKDYENKVKGKFRGPSFSGDGLGKGEGNEKRF